MTKDDVIQIDSPVGFKGRAVLSPFSKAALEGHPPKPLTCDEFASSTVLEASASSRP